MRVEHRDAAGFAEAVDDGELQLPGPGVETLGVNTPTTRVLVVGAGVAGLSCARALKEQGVEVQVMEKSRGVGGRCATRRIEGQPVDHGLTFYHGDDPEFLAELSRGESASLAGWPRRVVGEGAPCQPSAFRPGQRRIAFAKGVSTFPKHLARGLSVEFETTAIRIDLEGRALAVATASGQRYRASTVILALPAAQSADLLQTVEVSASKDLPAAILLLAEISTVRCLTLMAGYAGDLATPKWDVCYPRGSDILQLVSQDSAKRSTPARPVFVFQCRPRWSAQRWDDPVDTWIDAILNAAKPACGDWVTRPAWTDTHRWRHARLAGGDALAAPLLLGLTNGCRIGVAGEGLAAGGGVQAAWLSGRRMARRLLAGGRR